MKISELQLPLDYHPSMDIIDSTKIQAYQDCPRMYFYEYILGWRSAQPNNHLHFGKCVHKAMEHIIKNGYNVDSVVAALDLFNSEYRLFFSESTDEIFTPKIPSRFFDLLITYLKTYPEDPTRYTVYKTEFGGTVHLSNSHQIAFKMDTVLYDNATQKYCSLEHKTTAANYISDNYAVDFQLGIQLGTYTHVLNSLFPPEEVSGVIINCLCFKKTKAPDYILRRFPLWLSNAQMFNWLENTKWWMDEIHRNFHRLSETSDSADRMNCFPFNGRSCSNWGRICKYHDLCTSWLNPLQHLNHLPADMKVDFWNPLEEELTERLYL